MCPLIYYLLVLTQVAKGPRGWVWLTHHEKKRLMSAFRCEQGSDFVPSLKDLQIYIRSFLALHGSVFLWVGLWDLLDADDVGVTDSNGENWYLYSYGTSQSILYVVLGFVLIIAMDTFYANAAMNSPLDPLQGAIPSWLCWWQKVVHFLDTITMLYWLSSFVFCF